MLPEDTKDTVLPTTDTHAATKDIRNVLDTETLVRRRITDRTPEDTKEVVLLPLVPSQGLTEIGTAVIRPVAVRIPIGSEAERTPSEIFSRQTLRAIPRLRTEEDRIVPGPNDHDSEEREKIEAVTILLEIGITGIVPKDLPEDGKVETKGIPKAKTSASMLAEVFC